MIQNALARLLDGDHLTRTETREVMGTIMSGDATPAQIGGFLVALRLKGETADEIAGAAEAMRAHVVEVRPARTDLVDTAGTGGDGANTFNISTAAALVAAAAGAVGAKSVKPSDTRPARVAAAFTCALSINAMRPFSRSPPACPAI